MNPLLILAAALTAGSIYSNTKANQKIQGEQDRAMRKFQESQDQLSAAGRRAAMDTQTQYTNVPQAADQASADLARRLMQATRTQYATADPNGVVDNSSARTVGEQRRQSSTELNYTDRLGQALSKTMGFDRAMAEAELQSRQNAIDLNSIGQQARMDQGVLNTNLAVAPAAGAKWQAIGDILSMAAQASAMGGMKGPRLNTPAQAAAIPVRESVPTFVRSGAKLG